MAGSSRLLIKLDEAVQTHKYYEAHQLLKTINFRYTSGKKFEELEKLLGKHSAFLLDNKQFESGMDVAIMLTNLQKTAEHGVTEQRVDDATSLLKKMPNSPERGQFIHQILEWIGNSGLADKIHNEASRMYIEGRGYDDAWRHIIRLHDGKQAANYTMQIIQDLGSSLNREELGLVTAHLVLSMLAAKRVPQAEQAFMTMAQTDNFQHLSPLLNGLRFLIDAAKTNDPPAFQAIQTLYDMSFSRDPAIRKLVAAAGMSLFHLSDERSNNRGGLMSLFSALMNPNMS